MLTINNLSSGYGITPVLFDISFELEQGKSMAIVGRNGVGKTTLMQTIMGLLPAFSGQIKFEDKNIESMAAYKISNLGMGWVPEGRQIFHNLTVYENLKVSQRPGFWNYKKIIQLFPRIEQRKNNMGFQLSGGEQQMLAIARALLTNPKLLLLDEATEGLSPVIRLEIWHALRTIGNDLTLIIVDKNLNELDSVVDTFMVIEKGTIILKSNDIESVKTAISL